MTRHLIPTKWYLIEDIVLRFETQLYLWYLTDGLMLKPVAHIIFIHNKRSCQRFLACCLRDNDFDMNSCCFVNLPLGKKVKYKVDGNV